MHKKFSISDTTRTEKLRKTFITLCEKRLLASTYKVSLSYIYMENSRKKYVGERKKKRLPVK